MSVYVVVTTAPYEGQTLAGVYSTLKLAKEAAGSERVAREDPVIFMVEIDADPRFFLESRDEVEE